MVVPTCGSRLHHAMSLVLDEYGAADSELPTYAHTISRSIPTPRNHVQPHTEHTFHLTKNKKHWLSLIFRSRAADARDPPKFIQNSDIVGSLNLDLKTEVVVRSVTISVSLMTLQPSNTPGTIYSAIHSTGHSTRTTPPPISRI